MGSVTQFLSRLEAGDSAAADQLLPSVFNELHHFVSVAKSATIRPDARLRDEAISALALPNLRHAPLLVPGTAGIDGDDIQLPLPT